ncbi:MAG: primosomal protein N', partial [Burkholderiaceae bacterium]
MAGGLSSSAIDRPSPPATDGAQGGRRPSSRVDRSSGDGRAAAADEAARARAADAVEPPAADDGDDVLQPGDWVLVPWGTGRRVGLVLETDVEPAIDPARIRPLIGPLPGAPRADAGWLALGRFAARYYHRPVGEVLLAGVPKLLRTPPAARSRGNAFDRARQRWPALAGVEPAPGPSVDDAAGSTPPVLTEAQRRVHAALRDAAGFDVHLVHGITGSGKTEVYLHWLEDGLRRDPDSQWLLLVPEIGLTPQLVRQLRRRFAGRSIAILHSDLPDGERAAHWLAAAEGRARLIVGTRLAVLTPMPRLAGIVVDEEHDPSYRQQEGIRYSARDLAVALAQQRGVPIALGSATPSLESWLAGQRGRYRLHTLAERPGGGGLPALRIVDVRQPTRQSTAHRDSRGEHGLGAEAIERVGQAIARGEQALIFLNRRGYAPVLHCGACGWISQCDHCSAHRV